MPFSWTFWYTIWGSYPDKRTIEHNGLLSSFGKASHSFELEEWPPSFIWQVDLWGHAFSQDRKNKIHTAGIHCKISCSVAAFHFLCGTINYASHLVNLGLAFDVQFTLYSVNFSFVSSLFYLFIYVYLFIFFTLYVCLFFFAFMCCFLSCLACVTCCY